MECEAVPLHPSPTHYVLVCSRGIGHRRPPPPPNAPKEALAMARVHRGRAAPKRRRKWARPGPTRPSVVSKRVRPEDALPGVGGEAPTRRQRSPATAGTVCERRAEIPGPLCDIPSGCCSFTGPWTVTRSSLRMLRQVASFCRPLQPVLLLVSLPRLRSPVFGVLGLCYMWHGVPFARQRRPIVGVLRMCWLLPGSFDCFCCPHTSVHRPSIACLAVFPCARGPGALFLHALSRPSTICPCPPHGWSAPDGFPLLLSKQPIWAAGDTPHLMPVEQGLPWHPVATGLAGQAIPFVVAASHAHALPSPPFWFPVPAVLVASPALLCPSSLSAVLALVHPGVAPAFCVSVLLLPLSVGAPGCPFRAPTPAPPACPPVRGFHISVRRGLPPPPPPCSAQALRRGRAEVTVAEADIGCGWVLGRCVGVQWPACDRGSVRASMGVWAAHRRRVPPPPPPNGRLCTAVPRTQTPSAHKTEPGLWRTTGTGVWSVSQRVTGRGGGGGEGGVTRSGSGRHGSGRSPALPHPPPEARDTHTPHPPPPPASSAVLWTAPGQRGTMGIPVGSRSSDAMPTNPRPCHIPPAPPHNHSHGAVDDVPVAHPPLPPLCPRSVAWPVYTGPRGLRITMCSPSNHCWGGGGGLWANPPPRSTLEKFGLGKKNSRGPKLKAHFRYTTWFSASDFPPRPGQSPVLPFAGCVGSLLPDGRCGQCALWCRFRNSGAQWSAHWGCAGECGSRFTVAAAHSPPGRPPPASPRCRVRELHPSAWCPWGVCARGR